MASIGSLGALNYKMTFPPNGQQSSQQPVAQQPVTTPEAILPDVKKDPIAVRGKMTSDYYREVGLLRSFVADMAKEGIDPFTPDYAQEGGGLAHQTLLKLQANVLYAANALGNELDFEKRGRELEADNKIRLKDGVKREGLYYSNPDNFYSTALDPRTIEANKRTAQSFYTDRDVNAVNQAVHNPNLQGLEQTYQDPEELQYQQSGSFPATKEAYAPAYFGGAGANRQPKYLALHKNITNFTRGVWPGGTYHTGVVRGKTYEINESNAGDKYGKGEVLDKNGKVIRTVDKVLKQALKDGNGNVYYQYQDPDLPLELVSNQPPDKLGARHIASEDALGGSGAVSAYYNELENAGLIDPDTRSANPNSVFGEKAPELAKASVPTTTTDRELKIIKDNYDNLVKGEGKFNILTVPLPDGQKVKFAYDDGSANNEQGTDGVYIYNWKELGMNKEDRKKNITFDEFLRLLDEYGVWNKILDKKHPNDIPVEADIPFNPNWKTETPAQKALREYRERNKK